MGFFIPGLGNAGGGGAVPGAVLSVNGKTGDVIINAVDVGAVNRVDQAVTAIKLQSGSQDIGVITIITENAIDNIIGKLI